MAAIDCLQVLEEELVALDHPTRSRAYLEAKEDLAATQRARDEAEQADRRERTDRTKRRLAEAEATCTRAYATAFKQLCFEMHRARRSALCLSGGGIRSATFGLGVLQGLARCSRRGDDGGRPTLLGELDYLSTVSGGGYLGSWLSAWATRTSMPEVFETLGATPEDKLDPEPPPLRHLRNYTAYLAPRPGLLSLDTWTLISAALRNMVLNWLIVVPVIALLVLVPRVAKTIVESGRSVGHGGTFLTWDAPWGLPWLFLALGGLGVFVATFHMGLALPQFGARRWTQSQLIRRILMPFAVAAAAIAVHWAWHVLHHVPEHHAPWHFMVLGGALLGTGALASALWVVPSEWRRLAGGRARAIWGLGRTLRGFWLVAAETTLVLLMVTINGAVAGALLYVAATGLDGLTAEEVGPAYAVVAFPTLFAIFGATNMLIVALLSRLTTEADREWWARLGAWFLLLTIGWPLLAVPAIYGPAWLEALSRYLSEATATVTLGGVLGMLGWLASWLGAHDRDSTMPADTARGGWIRMETVALAAAVTFLALLIIALAKINDLGFQGLAFAVARVMPEHPAPGGLWLELAWGLALLGCASLFAFFVNINDFSLHAGYRSRLIRAYLGASNSTRRENPFTGFDPDDNVKMSELGRQSTGETLDRPLHVVNIALNLVKGENLAWQERKAESFTVTALHAGSFRVGYQPTSAYGNPQGGLDLGTAMAISGAAASPNMGYSSSPMVTLLMALFNLRLGWWLANPGPPGRGSWRAVGPRWALTHFVDEAFGLTTDRARWVYLSDGGHFEVLGLYEMVLRRCRTIVVVDAASDPDCNFEDLGNAVRKIRVDFGIPIEFPEGVPIHARRDAESAHCAVGVIQYHRVDGLTAEDGTPIEDGVLVYIKPSINENEPRDVLAYHSREPLFPQQPTADQFFDESQFESYRRLGAHIVAEICERDHPNRERTRVSLDEFVEAARAHALGVSSSRGEPSSDES